MLKNSYSPFNHDTYFGLISKEFYAKGDRDTALNTISKNQQNFNAGNSQWQQYLGKQMGMGGTPPNTAVPRGGGNFTSGSNELRQAYGQPSSGGMSTNTSTGQPFTSNVQATQDLSASLTPEAINQAWYGSGGIPSSDISNFGGDVMAGYKDLATTGGLTGDFWNTWNQGQNQWSRAMGDFGTSAESAKNFINTGGISSADENAMREAGLAPITSMLGTGQAELERSRALQGGYGGNYAAAANEMQRTAGQQASESEWRNQANIAQMRQQGREFGTSALTSEATAASSSAIAEQNARLSVQQLEDEMKAFGLSGMSDIEKTKLQSELTNAEINTQSIAAKNATALQGRVAAAGLSESDLAQLRQLYGNSMGMQLQSGLGYSGATTGALANVPGDFAQTMGNIGSVIQPVSDLAGAFTGGFGGLFKKKSDGGEV